MKYTNKYNLPKVFVRAAMNDPYDSGKSDFTPSSLDLPALAYYLIKNHPDKIVVDVSDRVDAIIGQGTHSVAERAVRPGVDICEERIYGTFTVDGKDYVVGAQLDLYETDTGDLYDWKTTKAYAFSKKAGGGKKDSWAAQLNIGAELLRRQETPHFPKTLTILALLKDWKEREAGTASCPEQQAIAVSIPMWTREETVKYIEDRIRTLVAATANTECAPKDNWYGRRCSRWCDASAACPQFNETQKTGLIKMSAGDK